MTLREQVEEAWPVSPFASTRELVARRAVLDLIDAHRCIDPDAHEKALAVVEAAEALVDFKPDEDMPPRDAVLWHDEHIDELRRAVAAYGAQR